MQSLAVDHDGGGGGKVDASCMTKTSFVDFEIVES